MLVSHIIRGSWEFQNCGKSGKFDKKILVSQARPTHNTNNHSVGIHNHCVGSCGHTQPLCGLFNLKTQLENNFQNPMLTKARPPQHKQPLCGHTQPLCGLLDLKTLLKYSIQNNVYQGFSLHNSNNCVGTI